jgi:hypothetical protein
MLVILASFRIATLPDAPLAVADVPATASAFADHKAADFRLWDEALLVFLLDGHGPVIGPRSASVYVRRKAVVTPLGQHSPES